ncbi:hypothetical protein, partial [Aquitalea sp. ASV11]|uniref:hypothetical protein n=1 Tax=Aquitalea sp. ASV11 TaxID=2795103 RepID=UPI001E52B049
MILVVCSFFFIKKIPEPIDCVWVISLLFSTPKWRKVSSLHHLCSDKSNNLLPSYSSGNAGGLAWKASIPRSEFEHVLK